MMIKLLTALYEPCLIPVSLHDLSQLLIIVRYLGRHLDAYGSEL